MKRLLAAEEIAELGVPGYPGTRVGVVKRAEKENWKFTWVNGQGGHKRLYITDFLPDEIRIHLAKAAAVAAFTPKGEAACAGAECGRAIRESEAEAAERRRIAREQGLAAFNQLPEHRRREAEARLDILRARDGFIRAAGLPLKRGSMLFCREFAAGAIKLDERILAACSRRGELSLSWSSLNRWQQDYDEHGIAGLAPGYRSHNKGQTSLTARQQDFLKAMMTDHPHARITTIMQGVEARFAGETIPHTATVRRWVANYRNRHASLLLSHQNPDQWRNQEMLAFGLAAEQVERLNQLWEFDSTPADVMFADGRHTIIGALDVFSRRAKLLVSRTSKAVSVAALTRRAIIAWGVPEIAKTDNGADYVSRHMVRVFDDLGIEQVLCPPFTPEAKPHIESFFRTFSHDLVEFLPSFIGHNVSERKDIEARRSFAERLMKRGGEPIEATHLTAAEFQAFCDDWCEHIYHHNRHSGLGGGKPAEVARNFRGEVRRVTNERALDILLCPAPGDGGHRTAGKKGILLDGRHYINEQLAALEKHERRVHVLLDATDAGTIYVYRYDEQGQRQYFCTAVCPELTGHDRAEIANKAKAIQAQVMREGRKELRRIAKEQATATIHQEIMDHRKGQTANIAEFPRRATEYTTEALEQASRAFAERDQQLSDQAGDELLLAQIEEKTSSSAYVERIRRHEKRAGMDLLVARAIEEGEQQRAASLELEKQGIVPIFATMSERYQWIRDSQRPLSNDDLAFLDEFYDSSSGDVYMRLEGDLRQLRPRRGTKRETE